MQKHTMTEIVNHSRSITFERSVKYYWGREGRGRGLKSVFHFVGLGIFIETINPFSLTFFKRCLLSSNSSNVIYESDVNSCSASYAHITFMICSGHFNFKEAVEEFW